MNKKLISRYITMVITVFFSALIYNFLLKPSHIVMGGVPGLALINEEVNKVNSSITIFIISIIMLILSFLFLGKERTKGTIVASVLYPIFVYITVPLVKYIKIDFTDLLVISICIGVLTGITNGLLYKTGFSNGGLPVISQILFKYFNISIGWANLFINTFVVILGSFVFGTTIIMYAIIANFINSMIVDKIVLGISENKAVYIFTNEKEKVKDFLINDMNHSATVFNVKGAFLKKKREMILTVIPAREYFQLAESLKILDPNVFYVVNDAYEVQGGK